MYKSKLTNRVHQRLVADEFLASGIIRELMDIEAILTPFVGTKVLKVDNYWTKKFSTAIEPIRLFRADKTTKTDNHIVHNQTMYLSKSYKSLYINFKAWFVYEQFDDEYKSDTGSYHELSIHLADLEDDMQTLKTIDFEPSIERLKSIINLNWRFIESKLKERTELLKQIKEIESEIPYYSYS